jgi:hypothetical protein
MPIIVNGESIDDASIRREAQAIRPQFLESNAGVDEFATEIQIWECAKENLIDRVLLKQAALAAIAPTPHEQIQAMVRKIREEPPGKSGRIFLGSDEELGHLLDAELRIEQFITQLTAHLPRPRNSEISEYYRRNRARFYRPEMAHASHIVKNVDEQTDEAAALAGIQEAARALKNGMPFEEVADRYSDCPGNGGDLGFFARGEMVEEFENVVFGLREGEVSEIFRSPFGFHIAKLHEKRPEGIRPLSEVRQEIEHAILEERRNAILSRNIQQLRERADIRKISATCGK